MIGQKFGSLLVIEKAGVHIQPNGKTNSRWLCKCDCGNETTPMRHDLKSGKTQSCGSCDSEDSYIYIIQDGPFIKIGYGKAPLNRLMRLQTGNPRELKLVKTFLCSNNDVKRIEKEIHEAFDKRRERGEWFRSRPRPVIRKIEKIMS